MLRRVVESTQQLLDQRGQQLRVLLVLRLNAVLLLGLPLMAELLLLVLMEGHLSRLHQVLGVVVWLLSVLLSARVKLDSGAPRVVVVHLEVLGLVLLLHHLLLGEHEVLLEVLALLVEVLLGSVAGLRHYRSLMNI